MMVTVSGELIIYFLFVGTLNTIDAQITKWTVPSITGANGTGAVTFPEDQAIGATSTQFAATLTSGTITSYTLSPATGTPFSVASKTGVLSLDSALDYKKTTSYTLKITASDSTHSGTATITVTVTDVNEHAPVFSAATYSPCIADKSPAGTTLTTVTATDKDTSQKITYAISSGNTNTDFKIDATGLIKVNDAKTLNKATTASYTLVVTAADNVATIKSGSTTVSVTVADSCGDKGDKGDNGDKGDKGDNGHSGTVVAAVSMMILIVSLFVTLF